jgi:SAM-dependent methyltransferase
MRQFSQTAGSRAVQRRRRSPSVPIYHGDWLLLHELARDIDSSLKRYAGGILLDVGCGAKPYYKESYGVERWIGLDMADNPEADIHGTAYDIPLEAESVDTVLCTQVLEHLETPNVAFASFYRVLRENGRLILSVPQYWPLHEEPRDFFRYTTIGLRRVAVEAGFTVEEMLLQGRGVAVAGQALNNAIICLGDTFPYKDHIVFKASKAPFYLAINLATSVLKPFLRTSRDVLNHVIVARKPSPV